MIFNVSVSTMNSTTGQRFLSQPLPDHNVVRWLNRLVDDGVFGVTLQIEQTSAYDPDIRAWCECTDSRIIDEDCYYTDTVIQD